MTPEHEAAVRRHTTRARTELENIISEAQLLHKMLEKGQYRDAQSIVRSAVTVTERMAVLETLSDVAEWEAAGPVRTGRVRPAVALDIGVPDGRPIEDRVAAASRDYERPSFGGYSLGELRDMLTDLGSRDWDLSTSREGLETALVQARLAAKRKDG